MSCNHILEDCVCSVLLAPLLVSVWLVLVDPVWFSRIEFAVCHIPVSHKTLTVSNNIGNLIGRKL